MKGLVLGIVMFFCTNILCAMSVNSNDYNNQLNTLKQELRAVDRQIGERTEVLREGTRRALRKFFRSEAGEVFMHDFVNGLIERPRAGYEDFMGYLTEFLAKYLGEELADFIIELTGVDAFKKHVLDLYAHVLLITDNQTCPEGVVFVIEDVTWIASYAAALYYIKAPIVPGLVATAVSNICGIIADESGLDTWVCSLIHRPRNEIELIGYSELYPYRNGIKQEML